MSYPTEIEENISCIIVDDEKRARNVLSKLITNYFPHLDILATAKDLPSASELIKELRPQ